jgi:hypothetical protein
VIVTTAHLQNVLTARTVQEVGAAPAEKTCRLGEGKLDAGEEDDFALGVCASCKARPEARRLGTVLSIAPSRRLRAAVDQAASLESPKGAREFTQAERSLIGKVHGYMPAQQLLDILNERLVCDLGPDARRYPMEQLRAEIGEVCGAVAGSADWPNLRKLIAQARRDGVLQLVDEQVIRDFAVVYSLNAKQELVLRDIVLQARKDAS